MTTAPSVSIVIPIRNESQVLTKTLTHLKNTQKTGFTEVIVVDGKSTDRSFSTAKTLADKVLLASEPGRARQMHEGALQAKGDILLFLHIDTILPSNWQDTLTKAWTSNPKPVATAFRPHFDKTSVFYRTLATMAHVRTRWLTGVPHGDQAIAVDRETYLSVGGFPMVPLMEEYELMKKLKPLGKLRILDQKVTTSARRYERNGPVYNNLRNLLIISLFYCGVSPKRLAKMYR